MAKRYHIKCAECGKSGTFNDEYDIRQCKWKILAWYVNDNEPICTCEKCVYQPMGPQSKKKK